MMTEIRDALDKGEFAAYKKRKLDGMQRIVYDGKQATVKRPGMENPAGQGFTL